MEIRAQRQDPLKNGDLIIVYRILALPTAYHHTGSRIYSEGQLKGCRIQMLTDKGYLRKPKASRETETRRLRELEAPDRYNYT